MTFQISSLLLWQMQNSNAFWAARIFCTFSIWSNWSKSKIAAIASFLAYSASRITASMMARSLPRSLLSIGAMLPTEKISATMNFCTAFVRWDATASEACLSKPSILRGGLVSAGIGASSTLVTVGRGEGFSARSKFRRWKRAERFLSAGCSD